MEMEYYGTNGRCDRLVDWYSRRLVKCYICTFIKKDHVRLVDYDCGEMVLG